MKQILVMSFFICNLFCYGQADDFIGELNEKNLIKSDETRWFKKNYKSYSPKQRKVEKFKNLFENGNFRFQIFFGTWCSDSQRDVPKMIKILNLADVPQEQYELIGVNEFKDLPKDYQSNADQIQLNRVPTLIVYKDGKPLNRFVEYARVSVLDDLIKILEQKDYKHSYLEN